MRYNSTLFKTHLRFANPVEFYKNSVPYCCLLRFCHFPTINYNKNKFVYVMLHTSLAFLFQACRVHDSTADARYLVIPMRPRGSEMLSEQQLRSLVTRDSMIGVSVLPPYISDWTVYLGLMSVLPCELTNIIAII